MRGITTVLATIFPLLIFSVADAQCRRGGGGGTSMGSSMASASPMSRGNFMPTSASTAMMSGMNMFNPLSSSTNAAARAARVRVQLAQQQALAQQRYFQQLAQQQVRLVSRAPYASSAGLDQQLVQRPRGERGCDKRRLGDFSNWPSVRRSTDDVPRPGRTTAGSCDSLATRVIWAKGRSKLWPR